MGLITVFTATFNRRQFLPRLFESLNNQVYKNFDWIIVDDGSTDDTESYIKNILQTSSFPISYFKQPNGGKHRAINFGLNRAKGTLFYIVDSDDRLPINALEIIADKYPIIAEDNTIAGMVGLKSYFNGQIVGDGSKLQKTEIVCSNFEFRYKHKIKGDRAEILKTSILTKYRFPEIEGERFLAESIVWDKIALDYSMLFFNESVYECEYLPDGLSLNSIRLRRNNPKGATLLYGELLNYPIPIGYRMKTAINYWRFAICQGNLLLHGFKKFLIQPWVLLLYPIGIFFYIKDSINSEVELNNKK